MNQEEMQKLAERRALAVAQGVSNANSYFAHKAQGAEVWSLDGKRYLDFAGGIGVMNVGHSNPKVVAAIQEQAARFTHVCFNVLMYEGYVELAEKLNRLTPRRLPQEDHVRQQRGRDGGERGQGSPLLHQTARGHRL